MYAPANRMSARTAGVIGTYVPRVRIGGRLRWIGRVPRGAAVVRNEPVAYGCRQAHRNPGVRKTLRLPERDGIVAAVATAELPSFVNHGCPEHLRAGTCKLVTHAAAVAETRGDDVRRVDAVVLADELEHGVHEG